MNQGSMYSFPVGDPPVLAGVTYAGQVTQTTALTAATSGFVSVNMQSELQSVYLPDATTQQTGGPRAILKNEGVRNAAIRDNAGTLLFVLPPGGMAYLALKDNTTGAGSWHYQGDCLQELPNPVFLNFGILSGIVIGPRMACQLGNINVYAAYQSGSTIAIQAHNLTTGAVGTQLVATGQLMSSQSYMALFAIDATHGVVMYKSSTSTLCYALPFQVNADLSVTLGTAVPSTAMTLYNTCGSYVDTILQLPSLNQFVINGYSAVSGPANVQLQSVTITNNVAVWTTITTLGGSTQNSTNTVGSTAAIVPIAPGKAMVLSHNQDGNISALLFNYTYGAGGVTFTSQALAFTTNSYGAVTCVFQAWRRVNANEVWCFFYQGSGGSSVVRVGFTNTTVTTSATLVTGNKGFNYTSTQTYSNEMNPWVVVDSATCLIFGNTSTPNSTVQLVTKIAWNGAALVQTDMAATLPSPVNGYQYTAASTNAIVVRGGTPVVNGKAYLLTIGELSGSSLKEIALWSFDPVAGLVRVNTAKLGGYPGNFIAAYWDGKAKLRVVTDTGACAEVLTFHIPSGRLLGQQQLNVYGMNLQAVELLGNYAVLVNKLGANALELAA